MCKLYFPFWAFLVLFFAGCGMAWRFEYTAPATLALEIKANAMQSPTTQPAPTPAAPSTAPSLTNAAPIATP